MMDEIEVKILDIDRKQVEEKLVSLGAKRIFDGEVYALFFDFNDNSINDSKDTVRLRKVGNKSFLTFKKFVGHDKLKVRKELEVEVSDFDSMKSILESLGLSEWLVMKKHRTSYALDDAHFEFDKHHDHYGFIPEFLEIETKDEKTLYRYVKLLGFEKEDCKPWTILDLEMHYSK